MVYRKADSVAMERERVCEWWVVAGQETEEGVLL